jgi:hypothetical protein
VPIAQAVDEIVAVVEQRLTEPDALNASAGPPPVDGS